MTETTMGHLAHYPAVRDTGAKALAVLVRVRQRLEQAWCGLRGHTQVLSYGSRSLCLRCDSCGLVSPGWTVGPQRYVRRPADAGTRRTMYRLAFTIHRRAA